MSSLRLVVNPEKMVIKETQRTYTYLNLYGYATDAVICNRILPDTVTDPYFAQWKDLQKQNIELIKEAFGELPMLRAPMFDRDVSGLDSLHRLGETLYGDRNPAEVMFQGTTHRIMADANGGYRLIVPLPFADKNDLDLYRSADELTLRVGPYRRNIVLPYALWNLEIGDAKFDEAALNIHFVAKA
jgi:arsenite-transporting ATPase